MLTLPCHPRSSQQSPASSPVPKSALQKSAITASSSLDLVCPSPYTRYVAAGLALWACNALQVGDAGNNEGPSGLNYYTNTFDHRALPAPVLTSGAGPLLA